MHHFIKEGWIFIEIWKDIPGWDGYQVSSLGNVKSFKLDKNGKLLKLHITKKGYLTVVLNEDKKSKNFQCHRLVLSVFSPIPNYESMEVNHKNENKRDNRLENLEWVTHIENVRYGTAIQRRAKAQQKKVLCVELNTVFDSMRQASERTNTNYGNISSCCNGRLPQTGGYHWKFFNEN